MRHQWTILILLIVLGFPQESGAMEWREFKSWGGHMVESIDLDSIDVTGHLVSVWSRLDFPKSRPLRVVPNGETSPVQQVNIQRINNCRDNTYATREEIYYSPNYAIVHAQKSKTPAFRPIRPDSSPKSLQNIACP